MRLPLADIREVQGLVKSKNLAATNGFLRQFLARCESSQFFVKEEEKSIRVGKPALGHQLRGQPAVGALEAHRCSHEQRLRPLAISDGPMGPRDERTCDAGPHSPAPGPRRSRVGSRAPRAGGASPSPLDLLHQGAHYGQGILCPFGLPDIQFSHASMAMSVEIFPIATKDHATAWETGFSR